MGNSSTKLAERCALLSKDEVPLVASSFKLVSKNSERIKEDDLMKFWGSQMDPRLAQYITNFLFGEPASRANIVEFQRFAELYVFSVRGSVDERIGVLLASVGQTDSENAEIAYPLIKEYVEAVVSSYMRALRLDGGIEFKSWEGKGFRIVKECIQKLAESLASEAVQQGSQKVTRVDATRWLQETPTFVKMLEYVFLHLYHYRPSSKNQHDDAHNSKRRCIIPECNKLLPYCEGLQYVPDYPAFTDISQMLFINSNLPGDYRHKWRFLFSSQIHGESFSTLMGRIVDQGPCVIIIEDTNGSVFGGFASESLSYGPLFRGNDSAFLFTLRPKMRCFTTSGYNDHYQYLNLHQQTMPNGLGMGGQFNYWGLWLDNEFGQGECSESCTTFKNYTQLSANKKFEIRNIEVWAVGKKPKKESEDGEPRDSILEGHLEDKAVMEMAGRGRYSEGYRDNKPTDIEFQN
ncbi:MTOR-associated protein MEAK7 isoform X2 [Sitodiplosis mosellana]|uniref:MTOR-associated protein MEAK7 isoform X2 n=1 Tax=Sitodiplosis mosellana TaxID=263140 RepID=UPI002443B73C|nr:MTOR-associated protein MEAK7 isoform X2 [Sitodiplosis mosellana]XP_055300790.1 MTOR-associated protein MEAK7 isoform X2 [Sitodiplosis mosellana]XP_055300791.1 MTOR-associated protein MEAK7 isoform X2 [Sitodiplosis mosellana]XP_055300792.1 MTOR-associated protein MEAK7 isoform X2 [Sitodiplosis mosellana]XP_055300794.1 MTOR-associated protein MEAK7 isoform X2 [Sitodiplosis mosellana]XP_055300795.1 MTOR-associated protein MEAK7 isoform X2 [Sitodiplosis mosellana]